ncbi:DUF899 family protein [Bradyrhizobium sp. AUGA SZCCT0431]|uniref:DUF899 family protein n=1 Tax=Bradyrhizobium sp. AUGA SZCCT0431 TaxID=2807674 RepID=UPI001BAA59F2|nr:DUF899 family protein [Bradyrhizobium sp. AUGA SZCCT0431]MBR1147528.1 DUF899 family protein [Bradyrhizobium sp. AUGA SZCCT0431]
MVGKTQMGRFHDKHFPDETDVYRQARDHLIGAEVALRRQLEEVARLRRSLPPGGKLKEDYVFDEGGIDLNDRTALKRTHFSELFEGTTKTLVIYGLMFAPGANTPCPMCASFLDSLNGAAPHIRQRVSLVVVAKTSIEQLRDLGRDRQWNNHRLLSSKNNTFNSDYNAQTTDQNQTPILQVFERGRDGIRHAYSTELQFVKPDAGQNPRHLDLMWPLWNVFDLVREGRGTEWFPSLSYDSSLPTPDPKS